MDEQLNCFSDLDCPSRLICYNNLTWNDYRNTNLSACGCESWYGWDDDDCLNYSSCTYMLVVAHCLNLLTASILILFSLIELAQRIFIEKSQMNASISTILLIIINFILIMILEAVNIYHTLSPSLYKIVNGFKQDVLYPYDSILQGGVIVLSYLVAINLALVWINVAAGSRHQKQRLTQRGRHIPVLGGQHQLNTLSNKSKQKVSNQAICEQLFNCLQSLGESISNVVPHVPPGLTRLRYVIFLCEILFVLMVVVCFSTSMRWLSSFLSIPFLLAICYMHIWGRYQVITELQKMKDYDNFDHLQQKSPLSSSSQQQQQQQSQQSNINQPTPKLADSSKLDGSWVSTPSTAAKSSGYTATSSSLAATGSPSSTSASTMNVYTRLCEPITITSRYIIFNIILGNILAILYATQTYVNGKQHPKECGNKAATWSVIVITYICTFTCAAVLQFFIKSRAIFVENRQKIQSNIKVNEKRFKGNTFTRQQSRKDGQNPGGIGVAENIDMNDAELNKDQFVLGKSSSKSPRYVLGPDGETVTVMGEDTEGESRSSKVDLAKTKYVSSESIIRERNADGYRKSSLKKQKNTNKNNNININDNENIGVNEPNNDEHEVKKYEDEGEEDKDCNKQKSDGSVKTSMTTSGVDATNNQHDLKGFEIAIQ